MNMLVENKTAKRKIKLTSSKNNNDDDNENEIKAVTVSSVNAHIPAVANVDVWRCSLVPSEGDSRRKKQKKTNQRIFFYDDSCSEL